LLKEYFNNILWYNRHISYTDKDKESWDPDILKGALEAAKEVEREIPEEHLVAKNDLELGEIRGKLSAIRWVLGEYWDFLDT